MLDWIVWKSTVYDMMLSIAPRLIGHVYLITVYNSIIFMDIALNNLQWLICHKTRRCPWCNGYRRGKWTRQHEFKC